MLRYHVYLLELMSSKTAGQFQVGALGAITSILKERLILKELSSNQSSTEIEKMGDNIVNEAEHYGVKLTDDRIKSLKKLGLIDKSFTDVVDILIDLGLEYKDVRKVLRQELTEEREELRHRENKLKLAEKNHLDRV